MVRRIVVDICWANPFVCSYVVFISLVFLFQRVNHWTLYSVFSAGKPLDTLFFIFPPVVFQVAEGLGYAVHRLAEGDGDLLVLATVVVLPGGDQ